MNTITKVQAVDRMNQLARENGLLLSALNHLARGDFVHVGKAHGHTVSLMEPAAAHGGIVLITFGPAGQKPYTAAEYLDDWFAYWRDYVPCATDHESIAVRELAFKARRMATEAKTA